jgi:hypothetical protein
LAKNTNAFQQILFRCRNYDNWPSPYCLDTSRSIFRRLFTRRVPNYRRAAGWPIPIFSERHSFPPCNFAKNGDLFAVAQGIYAIFVDTIFVGNFSSHLRVWQADGYELCLKGLSSGENFIQNDFIQMIAMVAARWADEGGLWFNQWLASSGDLHRWDGGAGESKRAEQRTLRWAKAEACRVSTASGAPAFAQRGLGKSVAVS